MKLFRKIDTATGLFLEDVLLDSIPILTETVPEERSLFDQQDNVIEKQTVDIEKPILDAEGNTIPDPQYIATPCPAGYYKPRWDGAQWVEGGTAPEPVPQPPTEKERIQALEDAMLTMMMGGI